jgi:hypothetical protein
MRFGLVSQPVLKVAQLIEGVGVFQGRLAAL